MSKHVKFHRDPPGVIAFIKQQTLERVDPPLTGGNIETNHIFLFFRFFPDPFSHFFIYLFINVMYFCVVPEKRLK